MLFANALSNFENMAFGAFALFCLGVASFCVRGLKNGKGIKILFAGILLLVFTSEVQVNAEFFYEQGVSAKILLLSEMLLILAASAFLIMASSHILLEQPLNQNVLFVFVTIGLLLVLYAIFAVEDANLVNKLQQILPIIGMSYVFLSFVSRPKLWKSAGRMFAGAATLGLTTLSALPLIAQFEYPWHLPFDMLLLLAFSYFLLLNENLKDKMLQAQDMYRKINQNIGTIIKSSPFPIMISRLGDDALLLVNKNAAKLFGIDESELPRYHFKDFFVDVDNRKLLRERLEKSREVQDFEILVKTAGGNTPFWLLASVNVIGYNNDVVLYAAFQDITSRKRRESLLQSQADRDPLTAVYNRRYFEMTVAEKIKTAYAKKQSFAVLMIDADNFKRVNDTYGHKIGDKVLMELAAICERSLRHDDVVARYGGEEFVVFLANVTADIAAMVAGRLKDEIARAVVYSDENLPVKFTVSIGVAPSGISDDVGLMIKMADDAMYAAKQNGRNRVELFNAEMTEKISQNKNDDDLRLMHPAFSAEENEEISLLDGIETTHMSED